MKDWFKKIFKRTKRNQLLKVLIYLFDNGPVIKFSKIKKQFPENYDFTIKVLGDMKDSLKVTEVIGKRVVKQIEITNHHELLKEIHRLSGINKEDSYRNTQTFLGLYMILIPLFSILISVFAISMTVPMEVQQLKISALDFNADLDIVKSKFDINNTLLDLCFLNRGGIDSGEIKIVILTDAFNKTISFKSVDSKGNFCFNQTFDENVSKLDLSYNCMNCNQEEKINLK